MKTDDAAKKVTRYERRTPAPDVLSVGPSGGFAASLTERIAQAGCGQNERA
jgi:hypothetical protein